jgi:UDP-sugar diphosphatase
MENNIKNFSLNPLVDPKFISTSLAIYEQNGLQKSWEIVQAHDSVSILIYHTGQKKFILVKQFRPAVYVNNEEGMSVELCAGIVDKKLTLQEIAQEEIEEECGYKIPLGNVEKITSFYTSVGFAGSKQTLYYAEVDESMKVSDGGGIEGEFIEVISLSIEDAKRFIYDENVVKTPGLMFSFMWWFDKIRN